MTRIIGGHAGSLSLVTPGRETRPTSDRVREAWFSKLDAHQALEGATVLDLYAGSGALGLEAASRGATRVTFVDKHPGAIRALTTNVSALSRVLPHAPELSVVSHQVGTFLQRTPPHGCDLVFIDPPYELSSEDVDAVLTAVVRWLAPDAWVMLERSSRSTPPLWPEGLEALDTKVYGETVVYFAKKS
jgi:16S rRNA (guanine966-N2)-methyltransferase